ncbi:hypothetical protein A2630_02350 [Candidatus Woesebacteria bacterium RIFCSPHIGHO2_01_FULL_44_10]|uniref:Uncharacterized protein n=1 Tax=Candidatus Woesebacteria bacterium RIFCSPLOWO2_01_FULL_44_14 TaxID=1802525 RepID=A0A1F8C1C9_9BACT|nr:MAG: hypothetical protein A2630_02350 [Candidatus Woesebacteria bacterium RIFCSPHIGHO2_01_FULL_44_10]OGM53972.1 MAG: hypothetical protein A3F62_00175 [Candidatus Woesebacteria bacterium RIFCSPHIGHO2_12_FULL_44_11]OGM69940.1 MAG: hypothetical protein A2975_05010 [Candidatus Woesebacteria bacterium RIFCSPLOWO2_01_FULL_44_14]
MYSLGKLNKEQLDGLAKFNFDLARSAFIVAVLPAPAIPEDKLAPLKMLVGLFWGLAFTYLALLVLKIKERIK